MEAVRNIVGQLRGILSPLSFFHGPFCFACLLVSLSSFFSGSAAYMPQGIDHLAVWIVDGRVDLELEACGLRAFTVQAHEKALQARVERDGTVKAFIEVNRS